MSTTCKTFGLRAKSSRQIAEPIVPAQPITRKRELWIVSLKNASFSEMSVPNKGAVRPINGVLHDFFLDYTLVYIIQTLKTV